jgi:hypothetical protein
MIPPHKHPAFPLPTCYIRLPVRQTAVGSFAAQFPLIPFSTLATSVPTTPLYPRFATVIEAPPQLE